MHPLDSAKVLSIENGAAGPFCTRLLGDFGAEVVKVEKPNSGDVHRQWDSVVHGISSAHVFLDRNKKSIELNLKSKEGRSVFLELAEKADIIVQNFAPGVTEKLGLTYEDIKEVNEDIIYLNISGYGETGPYSERKAYDLLMQGETGLISRTGTPSSPAKIPLSICDIGAGIYGALGILAGLVHRERTGEGQEVNTNMFSGMLSWLGYFPHKFWHNDEIPERVGTQHHLLAPYGPYKTKDSELINIAILSNEHWQAFCEKIIDAPELVDDERFSTNEQRVDNREQLNQYIEPILKSEKKSYWEDKLEAEKIPRGDVNQLDDVLSHPQIESLGLVRESEFDGNTFKYVDNPLEFSTTELKRERFPKLGEHTDEVLRSLGFSEEKIKQLRRDEVIN